MDCPSCQKTLIKENYCGSCQTGICPKCQTPHPYQREISWAKATLYTALLPFLVWGLGYLLLKQEYLLIVLVGVLVYIRGKWGIPGFSPKIQCHNCQQTYILNL